MAELAKKREYAVAASVIELYRALDLLYRTNKSSTEKITERKAVFDRHVAPLRSTYPEMKILLAPNNAEILQLKLYLTGLSEFSKLFERHNRSWSEFFVAIEELKRRINENDKLDPFEELQRL